MTQRFDTVLQAIRTLSAREKLQLIQAITTDLQQLDELASTNEAFWTPSTLNTLIATQQTPVITDIQMLVDDFWPEDETADDINTYIEAQRHLDRTGSR